MDRMFTSEQLQGALPLKAGNLTLSYCRNDGGGKFTLVPLPYQAQLSALNGIIADDLDAAGQNRGFLSQSARFLTVNENVSSVVISDSRGKTRKLNF